MVETVLVFGLGWLLGRGGGTPGAKKTAPASAPTSPSKVPWPGEKGNALDAPLPGVPWAAASDSPAEQAAAVKDAEKYAASEQAKLDAQANEAYKKAGDDAAARADIAKKYRARKKALDDYKREVERAKGGIANTPRG